MVYAAWRGAHVVVESNKGVKLAPCVGLSCDEGSDLARNARKETIRDAVWNQALAEITEEEFTR